MKSEPILKNVVVLGTGGTIAGTASSASDNIGYTAAQLGVAQLLDAIPALSGVLAGYGILSEQVAQIDSKDMRLDIWRSLAQRTAWHLAQPEVQAVLITHGTDTLEETAYFLHAVLPATLLRTKPVVLTCAMRPASSQSPDGPQNLLDSVSVALSPGAHGVVVVCAGTVHGARDVQKVHTYRVDAFNSGDAGPLAYVEEGRIRQLRVWPVADTDRGLVDVLPESAAWPRVEVVMSYAGCSGALVDALLQPVPGVPPLRGLVVAATGNGTVHADLDAALRRAQRSGVAVVRASRCTNGRVLPTADSSFDDSKGLSPVKARIALMLELMSG